ncbi:MULTISPECIES: hypothetical protein [unclassified Sphingobacterium]|uniref:hypothetical protein n=1 Tax=unclassified Sphingobacterium TaxID=2609468 RepID=UPI00038A2197|nr:MULTISPECIES: hypothetical protein [unclassified Sphingobacterium]KKX50612.1 hypothetical protein L950_0209275 [Sphingobacterium sp. IITKGP-BTPF85]MBB2952522.1 hypothetical protein [Sphingobacterium sp. JUb56]
MKLNRSTKWFALAAVATSVTFASCSKSDNNPVTPPTPGTKKEAVIEGKISKRRVLSADTTYLLRAYVQVVDGGTLEIPAGTVIKGEKATKGALIIERGGKIQANGTAEKPIVFTSDQTDGNRDKGDWSGIIICGKSLVNTSTGTAQYEGGTLGATIANYGGGATPVLDDNSGELTYARIEFAGIAIEKDKEINGLTLCAVGSGTKINHIQVSYGGDDSFEFFGGTVNATHLIAYRGVDDDFDFDQGYNGKIQYGISIKDPIIADAAGTSRGIELENKGTVSNNQYTRPILSNFTFVGPGTESSATHGAGIHFGLNSRMVLANSIIVGAKTSAVEFNSDFPAAELKAGRSILSNNMVFGNVANYGLKDVTSFASVADLTGYLNGFGDFAVTSVATAGLTGTSLSAPNLLLKSDSPALGKAKYEGDLASLTKETFIGAMGTTDWTKGWASWDPKNNKY